MNDIILKNFTVLTRDELELVLKWRNSERVRMMMVNKEEIPLAEHLAYAERLRDLSDRRYYLVCIGDRPCAVIDYTEMEPGVPTCNTGLYAGDGAPFGFGMLLEHIRYHGVFVRFGYPKTHSPMRKENERTGIVPCGAWFPFLVWQRRGVQDEQTRVSEDGCGVGGRLRTGGTGSRRGREAGSAAETEARHVHSAVFPAG